MTLSPSRPSRDTVAAAVKRVVLAESRLAVAPESIPDDEPLNGKLLRVNSLGFVGILIVLEDELGCVLPDDLFVARTFETVGDLVDVVAAGAEVP